MLLCGVNKLQELILSFHHVSHRDFPGVFLLSSKHLDRLNHLTKPKAPYFYLQHLNRDLAIFLSYYTSVYAGQRLME